METTNKRIPKLKSIKRAIEIFWLNLELRSKEIKELFGCSNNTAKRLKNIAMEYITENGVVIWDKGRVNTKAAFIAWGLDIKDLERRQKKLEELGVTTC